MTAPTDAEIISRALELLRAGVLVSGIPQALIAEFGITAARARRLVGAAIKRWKRRG